MTVAPFEFDFTKPIRKTKLRATVPAELWAGQCTCCARAAAVVSWDASPTGADLELAQAEAAGLWRRLGFAARPRVILGTDCNSFITAQCQTILGWREDLRRVGSQDPMCAWRPLVRCDFCLVLDAEPPMFKFRMWPAAEVTLPFGEQSQGRWAACAECSVLVAGERWNDLADRIARVQQNAAVTMLPMPIAKEAAEEAMTDVLRKLALETIDAFRHARITDPSG